jgi:hypothetical protein
VVVAPTTREAQRAELHRTIWRIANDLCGSVDGWDFNSYVLGMLFYRFISENLTAYLNDLDCKAGDADFDYAKLSDKDAEFGARTRWRRRASIFSRPKFSRPNCSRTFASALRATRTSMRRLNSVFSLDIRQTPYRSSTFRPRWELL